MLVCPCPNCVVTSASGVPFSNSILRDAVKFIEIDSGADYKRRAENERDLGRIKNGQVGTITPTVKDGNTTIEKETTIY